MTTEPIPDTGGMPDTRYPVRSARHSVIWFAVRDHSMVDFPWVNRVLATDMGTSEAGPTWCATKDDAAHEALYVLSLGMFGEGDTPDLGWYAWSDGWGGSSELWYPYAQVQSSLGYGLRDFLFTTEDECEQWIRDRLLNSVVVG